jgi:hypothetical protein
MTERVLLASNTLVTSATFFNCSQVVFAFSLSLEQKQRQTAQNNQTNSKTAQKQQKTIRKITTAQKTK